jgi:hypothetical protein
LYNFETFEFQERVQQGEHVSVVFDEHNFRPAPSL